MDVADRVVLITGASSGVGAALAPRLGLMGARVVVNYSRSTEAAEAVVEQIEGAGGQSLAVQADVSEEADCERLIAATIEQFGQLARDTARLVHEEALEPAGALDPGHAEAAQRAGGFPANAENAREAVGRAHHHKRIECAPFLVFLEHLRSSQIEAEPQRFIEHFDQRADIAQTKVEALARDRMHAVRAVADQREPVVDDFCGMLEAERP